MLCRFAALLASVGLAGGSVSAASCSYGLLLCLRVLVFLEAQFLRSSCSYGLLLCLRVLVFLEACVIVLVVVLLSLLVLVLSSFFVGYVIGGASVSAVLMPLNGILGHVSIFL